MSVAEFDYRLVSYAEDGVSDRLELPDVVSSQVSFPYGEGGALSLEVPRSGRNVDRLLGDALSWVAVEVCKADGSWVEPDGGRFLALGEDGDEVDLETSTAKVSAVSPDWLLSRVVWRAGSTSGARPDERAFTAASAGAILRAVIDEGLARGTLSRFGVDFSTFTASVDSDGRPWSLALSAAFKVGASAGAALSMLTEQGLVTPVWRGLSLRLLDTGGPSSATVADLVVGRDITEAPVRKTRAEVATVALVQGDDGLAVEVVDAAGVGRWGRLETTIAQSGVTDAGTLRALGEASLRVAAEQREEHTHGVAFGAAKYRPLIDYRPGEFVRSVTASGEREYRVRGITLTRNASGVVAGNVTLNDRIAEFEERVTRRLTGMSGGATVSGTGAMPRQQQGPAEADTTVPNAPTGLLLDSEVYHEQGPVGPGTWATIRAAWSAPETNTDGTPCGDLRSYELECVSQLDPRWRKPVDRDGRPLGEIAADSTSASFSPFWVGVEYAVRVRARDKADHVSAWSPWSYVVTREDDTPPPVPGPPKVALRLGVAVVTWDGKGAAGEGLPADFDKAVVHLRYSDGGAVVEEIAGAMTRGTLEAGVVIATVPYGTEAEVWLTSVDQSGNESARGEGALFTPEPVVDVQPVITELDAAEVTIRNAQQAWWDASTTLSAKLDTLKSETLAAAGRPVVSDREPTVDDGAGLPVGATWTVVTAGRMSSFWRWDGGAWANMGLDVAVIPKIDVGSGTVGMLDVGRLVATGAEIDELVADRIWSDVITGRKIAANQISLAGDSPNLFLDPQFTDPAYNGLREMLQLRAGEVGLAFNPGPRFDTVDLDPSTLKSFFMVSKLDAGKTVAEQAYRATPADTVWVEVPVRVAVGASLDGSTPTGTATGRLLVYWVRPDGSTYASLMSGASAQVTAPAGGVSTYLRGSLVVPDGVVGYLPCVQFSGPATASTVFAGASIRVTPEGAADPYLDATVIAGGSITTSHLAALSVTAGKIAALAVSSDKIAANAVTAGKIAAGAITAEKIDATAIDGKVITGATIRTGTSNPMVQFDKGGIWASSAAGYATFKVSSSTGEVYALGKFQAVHPSNTSWSATLSAQAFGYQPGVELRSGMGWQFEGALVSKSSSETSYTPGAVALHGAEASLNSTGRSELVLEPNGRGWALRNVRGPYPEAGIYSIDDRVSIRGRLANSPAPVIEAYQVTLSGSLPAGNSIGFNIAWNWPDGDETRQIVTTGVVAPGTTTPKLFHGMSNVSRTGCTVVLVNDGASVSGPSVYVTRIRKQA